MFAKRLRQLRHMHYLTQKQLAEAIGLNRTQIAGYESAKQFEPDYETLRRIAGFFNVSVDYLVGFTDVPAPSTTSELTEDEAITIALSKAGGPNSILSEESISKVRTFIKFLQHEIREELRQREPEEEDN